MALLVWAVPFTVFPVFTPRGFCGFDSGVCDSARDGVDCPGVPGAADPTDSAAVAGAADPTDPSGGDSSGGGDSIGKGGGERSVGGGETGG